MDLSHHNAQCHVIMCLHFILKFDGPSKNNLNHSFLILLDIDGHRWRFRNFRILNNWCRFSKWIWSFLDIDDVTKIKPPKITELLSSLVLLTKQWIWNVSGMLCRYFLSTLHLKSWTLLLNFTFFFGEYYRFKLRYYPYSQIRWICNKY